MSDKNEYKTSIDETHHVHKVDKPSGTAITLAKDIISDSRHRDWEIDSNTKGKININSLSPSTSTGGSFVTSFGLKSDIYSSIGNAIDFGDNSPYTIYANCGFSNGHGGLG